MVNVLGRKSPLQWVQVSLESFDSPGYVSVLICIPYNSELVLLVDKYTQTGVELLNWLLNSHNENVAKEGSNPRHFGSKSYVATTTLAPKNKQFF